MRGLCIIALVAALGGGCSDSGGEKKKRCPLDSVTPDVGAKAGMETVTLTGSKFEPGMQVIFGISPATGVSVISSKEATAVTPSSPVEAVVDVTVILPGGRSCTLQDAFTYDGPCLAGCPGCIASRIEPAEGPLSGSSTVIIEGAGFQPTSIVSFGSTQALATVYIGPNELQVVTPPSPIEGCVDVSVSNDTGTVVCRIPDGFRYGSGCALTAVDPTDLCAWIAEPVLIFGDGFQTDATANIFSRTAGATALWEVEVLDSQTIRAKVPDQLTTINPVYDVEVINPDGTRCFLSPAFTVSRGTGTACDVSGISPTGGSVAGGETVTITGDDFPAVPRVVFAANEAVVISSSLTEIVVEAPAGKQPGPAVVKIVDEGCTRFPCQIQYNYQ
jgi:hypothetical protein